MLYPTKTIDFKNLTIGYFDWVVEDKIVTVIRVVGVRKDKKIVDQVFKLDLKASKVVDILLK